MKPSQKQSTLNKVVMKNLLAVIISGSILGPINNAYAVEDIGKGQGASTECDVALQADAVEDLGTLLDEFATSDQVFQASMEEISLNTLVSSDPGKNLAVQHPFVIMTAAQRLYSIIMSQGYEVENVRGVGPVRVFNIFSVPSEINGGKIIVGHEKEIEKLVDSLGDAIDGSVKVPFLLGPSGTGKTLIQDIFRKALAEVTLNSTKQFYYTFEWVGLENIPGPAELVPGGRYKAPLHDSPITLLPKETQKKVVEFASKHLKEEEKIVGDFDPISMPDPHSFWIRQKVLEYYTRNKGSALNEKEIMKALDKHIVVKRQILGTGGSAPVMDSQGRDYNQGDLLLAKDPINSTIAEGRTKNPMAWNFGLIPGANGSVLFLDEFPRNDKTLRDIFLRIFESHEITLSGAPLTPVDAFILAAGNLESLKNLTGSEDSRAHRDRIRPIPFNWSIYPHKIAATMLFMYGAVYTRDLSDPNTVKQKANLLDVVPRTLAGEDYKGPDGRYELWLGKGEKQVHVSPHALMLIANIASATRIHFNGAEALTKENTFIANTATYQHPVERVKYLNGKLTVSDAEEQELKSQSMLNNEGHFGLSARDATEWLREAAHRARKQGGDLTPTIVMDTFRDMVNANELEKESVMTQDPDKTRQLWLNIADMIASQILLPDLQQDFNAGLANESSLIESTYDKVLLELIADGNGQESYVDPATQSSKRIDTKRLNEIKEIYKNIRKSELDTHQLATFFAVANQRMNSGQKYERDSGLVAAIQQFYAKRTTENLDLVAMNHYAHTGQGEVSIINSYNRLVDALKAKGYSEVGVRETLALVEELENRIAQAKEQKK